MPNVLPAPATTQGAVSPTATRYVQQREGAVGFPQGDRRRTATRWREIAKTRRAFILVQGDSLTGGVGATATNGYAQRFKTYITSTLGYTDAGPGFIYTTDSRVTNSGFSSVLNTVSNWTRSGLVSDTAAITQDMVECHLMYFDYSATHGAEVSIDGGSYSTLTLGQTGSLTHKLVSIPGITAGTRTVSIRVAGTGLHLDGFVVYTQTSITPSVCVSVVALGGMAGAIPGETSPDCYEGHVRVLAPDLAVFCYGTNDHNANYTPDYYRAGLEQYAAAAQGVGADVVLLAPLAPNIIRNYTWRQRMDALRQAARTRNCLFVETNRAPIVDTFNASLLTDTLHPNDAGYTLMLNALLGVTV